MNCSLLQYYANIFYGKYDCRCYVLWNDFGSMEAKLDILVVNFIDFKGGIISSSYRIIVSGVWHDRLLVTRSIRVTVSLLYSTIYIMNSQQSSFR